MKPIKYFLFVMIMAINSLPYSLFSQSPSFLDSSYAIVFQDEFTGTSLDYNKWQRNFPWGPANSDTIAELCVTTTTCNYPANTYGDLAYNEYHSTDTNFIKVYGGSAKLILKKQNYTGEKWSYPACSS